MDKKDPPASEFMRRDVISVRDTDTIWDIAKLFTENEISGAPVVNAEGDLVGVLSQTDIVRHLKEVASTLGNRVFYADTEDERDRPHRRGATAGDLMNPQVIQAPMDTPASRLGCLMLSQHIHRIIITDGKRLCGIVTTLDLIKVL